MAAPTVHRLRVAEVIEETADACSVVFDLDPHQQDRFRYRPGQFLTLRIPHGGNSLARCYSLASAPDAGNLKITVKRMKLGIGSNWLCDNARSGQEIDVLEPAGAFTPKSLDRNFLLVAGGSGITPVMSILQSVMTQGSGVVTLLYANRDTDSVIFDAELAELAARHPERLGVIHWLESERGLPASDALAAAFLKLSFNEVFICGPAPFMDAARDALKSQGFPREHLHIERFTSLGSDPFSEKIETPTSADESATDCTVVVERDGKAHAFNWPASQRLLDVLSENGIEAPSSCGEGVCAACECRLTEGRVEMVNNQVLEEDDIEAGFILACQSLPRSAMVRITYDS